MVDQVVNGRCLSSQAALPPSGLSRQEASQAKPAAANASIIVHNVTDRRHDWIGPWEVEANPIDITTLWAGDEGRTVIYRDHGRGEAGTLSSWTATTVFARFHKGDTAAGCDPSTLHFAIRDATPDFYRPFFASVDTHPKDGDALAAPLVSGAVPAEERADAHPGAGQ